MAVLKQTGNSKRLKGIFKFWFKTVLFIISSIFCRTIQECNTSFLMVSKKTKTKKRTKRKRQKKKISVLTFNYVIFQIVIFSYVHSGKPLSMAVLKQTGNYKRLKEISKFWFKTR